MNDSDVIIIDQPEDDLDNQVIYKELTKANLPVFSDSNNQYLDTIEIQTIMSMGTAVPVVLLLADLL